MQVRVLGPAGPAGAPMPQGSTMLSPDHLFASRRGGVTTELTNCSLAEIDSARHFCDHCCKSVIKRDCRHEFFASYQSPSDVMLCLRDQECALGEMWESPVPNCLRSIQPTRLPLMLATIRRVVERGKSTAESRNTTVCSLQRPLSALE